MKSANPSRVAVPGLALALTLAASAAHAQHHHHSHHGQPPAAQPANPPSATPQQPAAQTTPPPATAPATTPPPAEAQPAAQTPPQAPPQAQAQQPAAEGPSVAEARRHYAQGAVFFRTERYEAAIAEFNEAFSLWQNPVILYSLGQAHERLLHVPRAIQYYERYLELAPADAANRTEVSDTIRGLRTLLADVTLETNVPAHVRANGEAVGDAPGTIQLATGRYELEFEAENYETTRQSLTVVGQTHPSVSVTLRPAPPRVLVQENPGLAPGFFYAGVVATGAALGTATVLGVITLAQQVGYDATPHENRTNDQRQQGQRFALATDIALGATALFGVASAILFLNTDWRHHGHGSQEHAPGDDEHRAQPAEGPAVTHADVAPVPGGAVLSVGGRF